MSFGDDLSGGSIKIPNPNLISKSMPLNILPYITKCQRFKSELQIVTSNLKTSIQLDLSKKGFWIFNYSC